MFGWLARRAQLRENDQARRAVTDRLASTLATEAETRQILAAARAGRPAPRFRRPK